MHAEYRFDFHHNHDSFVCVTISFYPLLSFPCRFWWLKIDALAGAGEWIELERFAKGKKSPVGYEVRYLSLQFTVQNIVIESVVDHC